MCASQITNIALVGIGSIGKRHHMAIEQIDNVNLAGIVDLSKHAKIYCDEKKIPLYENINKRKKAGTSRSKKKSTISTKAYKAMKAGFPKKKKK